LLTFLGSDNIKDDVNIDPKELHEFANLFSENLNEELDLLNKEEEVLIILKNNLLFNSDLEDGVLDSNKLKILNMKKESPILSIIGRRSSSTIHGVSSQSKRNKNNEIKKKK
jgi:hypothetical protein